MISCLSAIGGFLIMEGFKSYLLKREIIPEPKVVFYLHWVTRFYAFCNKQPGDKVLSDKNNDGI